MARILESKLPSPSATRWGPLAGLQVSSRPGTLELALQLPLLLFGSVHKKAPAPPPAPPSRPHAPAPPTTHTPTPAVGQMNYSLRLGARTGEGLKLWGWPFKWLLALPPLWCPRHPIHTLLTPLDAPHFSSWSVLSPATPHFLGWTLPSIPFSPNITIYTNATDCTHINTHTYSLVSHSESPCPGGFQPQAPFPSRRTLPAWPP